MRIPLSSFEGIKSRRGDKKGVTPSQSRSGELGLRWGFFCSRLGGVRSRANEFGQVYSFKGLSRGTQIDTVIGEIFEIAGLNGVCLRTSDRSLAAVGRRASERRFSGG